MLRRLLPLLLALSLMLFGAVAGAGPAWSAPLPPTYGGGAGGDVLAVDLDGDLVLADVRLAVSESTVDTSASPDVTSAASNLAVDLAVPGGGADVAVDRDTQTAPPDNRDADTGTLAAVTVPGLVRAAALTSSVEAHYVSDDTCTPDDLLADSRVRTTGVTVGPTGNDNVATTGDAATRGVIELVPQPAGDPAQRAVRSTATGTISSTSFFDGAVQVDVTDPSTLTATATGEPGGASVDYDPGTITVTSPDGTLTLAIGTSVTVTVPAGQVVLTANDVTADESTDGRTATGIVSVVSATVRVGPAGNPTTTGTVDLMPLRASATAPDGGIDCTPPPPVLTTPADGSTTDDRTPTFTGTAVPGSTVDVTVDGDVIATDVPVDDDGNFTFTPANDAPLPIGARTATATQTTTFGTSTDSDQNTFTITPPPPVLTTPADGSTTDDRTPTFTGTAVPGSTVDITVDGDVIATDVPVDDDGNFTFTPAADAALPIGDHDVSVRATVGSLPSDRSETTTFAVTGPDTTAPDAPVVTRPADGSRTRDATPDVTGTAEPGARVEVFVDGTSVGTATATADGDFTVPVSGALTPGKHTVYAVATDRAGNRSDSSNTNTFTVTVADTTVPDAPVITEPADGSSTTDPTPVITGTAEPGSTVTVVVDGQPVGTTVADDDGTFSVLPSSPLSVGGHVVTATATDAAGNRSEPADPVTVAVVGADDLGYGNGNGNGGSGGTSDGGSGLAATGGPGRWIWLFAAGCLGGSAVLLGPAGRRRRTM